MSFAAFMYLVFARFGTSGFAVLGQWRRPSWSLLGSQIEFRQGDVTGHLPFVPTCFAHYRVAREHRA